MFVSPLGPALPPALASFVRQAVENGAAPLPLVPLNTSVPSLGPITLDHGGAYTLTVYPGAVMKFAASPKLGRFIDMTS